MISIWMIKIGDASIFKPLELISRSCLKNGKLSTEWKKANLVPAHKKGDKQNLKNYRPISLFSVAGKTFERTLHILLYIYEFFIEDKLISPNQSRLKPGDLCINQLPSINNEIKQILDDGLEVLQEHLIRYDTRGSCAN